MYGAKIDIKGGITNFKLRITDLQEDVSED